MILTEFLHNFRQTGAVMGDSSATVNAFCDPIPFDSAKVIVEFGPGTGAITRELIRRKQPNTRLICFEKNPTLYESLVKTVSGENLFILNADVFSSPAILSEKFDLQLGQIDCIVSSLPGAFMDYEALLQDVVSPLLKNKANNLHSEEGLFVTYQYLLSKLTGHNLASILDKYFQSITTKQVWSNLPPAIVLTGTKKKRQPAEMGRMGDVADINS